MTAKSAKVAKVAPLTSVASAYASCAERDLSACASCLTKTSCRRAAPVGADQNTVTSSGRHRAATAQKAERRPDRFLNRVPAGTPATHDSVTPGSRAALGGPAVGLVTVSE